jgi:cytoskeletal protein RodZ
MRKRLTLEQIAQATKINLGTLQALENDDFERLPASVYTRGFLRSFAREVDLDPEEMVDQYLEQIAALAPAPLTHSAEYGVDDTSGEASSPHHRTIVIPRAAGPAMALAILLVGGVAYFATTRQPVDPVVTTTAEAATQVPDPAPTPVSDVARAANVQEEADELRIELTATGPCWVSATTDREASLSRLLQAGEKHELRAKDELVLRVGDPSTISVSVNGVPGRPLGSAGQPVTVQINKQNFRDFQQL